MEPLRNGQGRSGLRRAALLAALWYNNLRKRRGGTRRTAQPRGYRKATLSGTENIVPSKGPAAAGRGHCRAPANVVCLLLWYNNLTALAEQEISTPERTLYHKLRISKEIWPAAAVSAAAKNSACCILQKKAQILQQNLLKWL